MTNTIVTVENVCTLAVHLGIRFYHEGKSAEAAGHAAMALLEETWENRVAYAVTIGQARNNAISAWLEEEEEAG